MKNIALLSTQLLACAVLAFTTQVSNAADFSDAPPPTEIDKTKYSPYPEQNYPNRVFFGDTHLHTSDSTDAGMVVVHSGQSTTIAWRKEK